MEQLIAEGDMGQGDIIENRTFDEIAIGDSASLSRTLSKDDIALFATMSGDANPAHLDESYAQASMCGHHIIGQGMWAGAIVSAVLGTRLPGPGTIYVAQDLQFLKPLGLGDTITVTVTAKEKRPDKRIVIFDCHCNQNGEEVETGTAVTMAPAEKIRRPRVALPELQLRRHDRYQQLVSLCASLEPIPTAVVHPCDQTSLEGAVRAAEARLIVPVLVGPEAWIRSVAQSQGLDIAPYEIVSTEHNHAAAAKAVALARTGKVEALMRGSLHTDELMHEVTTTETGLRTARRISHAFVMDVPCYADPLIITDRRSISSQTSKESATSARTLSTSRASLVSRSRRSRFSPPWRPSPPKFRRRWMRRRSAKWQIAATPHHRFNTGSSSIKFSSYAAMDEQEPALLLKGQIEGIGTMPHLVVKDANCVIIVEKTWSRGDKSDHEALLGYIIDWMRTHLGGEKPFAIGHRVLHDGTAFAEATLLDEAVLDRLQSLCPLAPLQQPHNLAAIRAIAVVAPWLPQVACFDAAFHHDQPTVAQRFALPRELHNAGVRRYGFHGLSYDYIASALRERDADLARGRVVVVHLGSGASLCVMRDGKSIDTTMGFTALDGLPMGTRCGGLDPGVVLYLQRERGMSIDGIEKLLYHQSGLLGVSEISNDMRELLVSRDSRAEERRSSYLFIVSSGNWVPLPRRLADWMAWFLRPGSVNTRPRSEGESARNVPGSVWFSIRRPMRRERNESPRKRVTSPSGPSQQTKREQ